MRGVLVSEIANQNIVVSQPKPQAVKQLNLVPPRWDRPLELLEGLDRSQGVGEQRVIDVLCIACPIPWRRMARR